MSLRSLERMVDELRDRLMKAKYAIGSNVYTAKQHLETIDAYYGEALAFDNECYKTYKMLCEEIVAFEKKQPKLSKDDIEMVYDMLQRRKIHPTGEFDKRGRFYLEDYELVNVRAPSASYPFSQMTAGRTKKFVKAIAEKYRVQNFTELLSHFTTKN